MKKETVTEKDLFAILEILNKIDMKYWLDGGWGVDILTGKQNREHRDIDIDFDANFTEKVIETLTKIGYEVVVDWMPARMELWHENYGYIDIHPLILDEDGSAKQADLESGFYHFEKDYFTKVIYKNREIACISKKAQELFHTGYKLTDVDLADLENLKAIE
ncbi:nucleotidyltransferase domain-containing protein [Desemzia sp. RIT 804]|uniref:nucleotidyltransferase domain-containing protein n=1 Tax=Desemzia sp. RIT 804 TaxID=2810209 RepID=UPI00351C2DAE